MKKFLTLILAVAMMATLSVSAWAETVRGETSKPIDVSGEYKDNSTKPGVISVDVTWGAMEFTYTVSGSMDWNSDNHDYDDNTRSDWTENGNTVNVVNHSNVPITVSFAFTANTGYSNDELSPVLTTESVNLPTAENVSTNDLSTLTTSSTLTFAGTLKAGTTVGTTIGSINVSIVKTVVQEQ